MAKEALDKVREAEAKAEKIMRSASEDVRRIRLEADEKAVKRYGEILAQGEKDAERLREEARKAGGTLAKPILENGEIHKARIENMKEKDLDGAVNIIIERIVSANGHR